MKADLACLAAGIVHVEHPLVMALAAGAGGAPDLGGMEGVTFQQRAAQDFTERGKASEKLADGSGAPGLEIIYESSI